MEDRFETEEENMADFMVQNLPREDALEYFSAFYQDVWRFYMEHFELMNHFAEISKSKDAFKKILEICRREERPELFAAAIALQKEKLQVKR